MEVSESTNAMFLLLFCLCHIWWKNACTKYTAASLSPVWDYCIGHQVHKEINKHTHTHTHTPTHTCAHTHIHTHTHPRGRTL